MDADLPGAVLSPPDHGDVPVSLPGEFLPSEVRGARLAKGLPVDGMSFLSCKAEASVTASKRYVELYVAAFGNVDLHDEFMRKGVAEQTISEDGPKGEGLIKLFFNHVELLGPCVEVKEDSVGIFFAGQVDDARELDRYLEHCKSGAAKHGSIGFNVRTKAVQQVGTRRAVELTNIKLYEGSPVIWPANVHARMVGVKSLLAMGIPFDTKGLWELADAVNALATIESAQKRIASLLDPANASWAALTSDQAGKVLELVQALVAGGQKLGARVSELTQKARPDVEPAATTTKSGADDQVLRRLAAALRPR